MRLIINDCELLLNEQPQKKQYTNSVFKDEEVRTLLLNIFHSVHVNYVKDHFITESIPDGIYDDAKNFDKMIVFQ